MNRYSMLTLTSLMLLCGASAAQAIDTQAAWAGLAEITASTPQCAGVGGAAVGNAHVSVYRPKIASTDTNTYLSLISTEGGVTMQNTSEPTAHQMHGSGNDSAVAIDRRALPFTYVGTYSFIITPPAVIGTTPVVDITGTVNTYFNVPGCNISFTAAYTPVK